ncbi:hypothetical protein [Bradyrhizobium sp. LTSP885]|uniref:hypothetical protein n=1 Tax=Bradyrhizobium sp. LTSP885 TaxID=1619232 RepID=UPI0005C9057F|nr:hypothetical protein [Bradyrhizobium sp. LTSP885]
MACLAQPEGSDVMHTFSDNYTLGKFNAPSYASWLAELRALFPVPDEFLLADAIFSFASAFKEGKTPQQAYEVFDIFVSAEA